MTEQSLEEQVVNQLAYWEAVDGHVISDDRRLKRAEILFALIELLHWKEGWKSPEEIEGEVK